MYNDDHSLLRFSNKRSVLVLISPLVLVQGWCMDYAQVLVRIYVLVPLLFHNCADRSLPILSGELGEFDLLSPLNSRSQSRVRFLPTPLQWLLGIPAQHYQ